MWASSKCVITINHVYCCSMRTPSDYMRNKSEFGPKMLGKRGILAFSLRSKIKRTEGSQRKQKNMKLTVAFPPCYHPVSCEISRSRCTIRICFFGNLFYHAVHVTWNCDSLVLLAAFWLYWTDERNAIDSEALLAYNAFLTYSVDWVLPTLFHMR